MTSDEKTLNLLGLARRAGKLVTGEALTIAAIRKGKVKFVFLASDAGSAVTKKIHNQCAYYQAGLNDAFNRASLSGAIGQARTVIGITDAGFAQQFKKLNQSKQ